MSAQQLEKLNATQRRMLRNMVGWTRMDAEDWSDTMRRMRRKVESALLSFPVADWSAQFLRNQFRFARRVAVRFSDWPFRVSQWQPGLSVAGAERSRGRPQLRWDNRLSCFALSKFDSSNWLDAFSNPSILAHADA